MQRYKLVNGKELYDMAADPGERHDIAGEHADIVAEMRRGYEEWFRDVGATRGYDPPRIPLGTAHENPVTLTRQDWRGADGWGDRDLGHWEVEVAHTGTYAVTLRFSPIPAACEAQLKLGDVALGKQVEKGASECTFESARLERGEGRLEASIEREGKRAGVAYVDVRRVD
jgi:arylsulfatase/arylsulfatase A